MSKTNELVILCGGKGTRLSEETKKKPKPLVAIGGRAMLWHIMKVYSSYGIKRFILALGYKGDKIKEYFAPGIGLQFKQGDKVNAENVVARTSLPGNVHMVKVSNRLNISPADINDVLLFKEGDDIKKGSMIAQTDGLFGFLNSNGR